MIKFAAGFWHFAGTGKSHKPQQLSCYVGSLAVGANMSEHDQPLDRSSYWNGLQGAFTGARNFQGPPKWMRASNWTPYFVNDFEMVPKGSSLQKAPNGSKWF